MCANVLFCFVCLCFLKIKPTKDISDPLLSFLIPANANRKTFKTTVQPGWYYFGRRMVREQKFIKLEFTDKHLLVLSLFSLCAPCSAGHG